MKNFTFASKDAGELYNKQIKSLYESNKEPNKRLKALQGVYKVHEHTPNGLIYFFNQNSSAIFEVLYLSIIKFFIIFFVNIVKFVNFFKFIRFHTSKFRLSSGFDEIKSLFSMVKQCFDNLEKERIRSLVNDSGKEIYVLFFYSLDSHTKKEIRLISFNILLRIIDAFLTEKNFDNAKPNESKQEKEKEFNKDVNHKLPTELHEFFLNSIEFNLYSQKSLAGLNIAPFQENAKLFWDEEKLSEIRNGEWVRLIKENNAIAGVEELILKVNSKKFKKQIIFFMKFLNF